MVKKTTPNAEADDQLPVTESELPVGPTGRFLVTMAPGSQRNLIKTLKDSAGITAASTADSEDSTADIESLGGGDALLFEHLSVAVVSGEDADKIQSMEMAVADDSNPIVAVEPEEYVQSINDQGFLTSAGREYVRGYRDGVATWGVGVFSSTKMPTRYAVFQGTSMATPHVAGIAALWSQRTGLRAMALWQKLISTALNIGQPVSAVGRGLVQAPVP